MFSKFLKKKQKELKEIIEFKYDDNHINILLNLNQASKEVKSYLELIIEDLEDEEIAIYNNNILSFNHKNIYKLTNDNLIIFGFPIFFDGNLSVELDGLINQDNSKFIIQLFESGGSQIIPYKIVGSILQITSKRYFLLPNNLYDIFIMKNKTIDGKEFLKYQFIELLQKDITEKVKFNGFRNNDFVETISTIELNISENENNDIVISPKISDLDDSLISKYENVEFFQ